MLIDFYACAAPPIHMSLFSLFEHLKAWEAFRNDEIGAFERELN